MIVNLPVFIEGRIHKLTAERIFFSQSTERFRIMGHDRSVIVDSDLPCLKTRKRKGEKIAWKIVSGEIKNPEVYQQVLHALEMKCRAGAFDDLPDLEG